MYPKAGLLPYSRDVVRAAQATYLHAYSLLDRTQVIGYFQIDLGTGGEPHFHHDFGRCIVDLFSEIMLDNVSEFRRVFNMVGVKWLLVAARVNEIFGDFVCPIGKGHVSFSVFPQCSPRFSNCYIAQIQEGRERFPGKVLQGAHRRRFHGRKAGVS